MGEQKKGTRCEVCVGCGKCLQAWDLASGEGEDAGADAVTGATNWAEGFKRLDDGSAGTPPPISAAPGQAAPDQAAIGQGAPGQAAPGQVSLSLVAPSQAATGQTAYIQTASSQAIPDAVTGATPGVATACKELGLDNMEALHAKLGIKPPGEA